MIAKEWEEVFRNRIVLFTVAFLPLLLTGLPLGILYAMRQGGDLGGMSTVDMPAEFATLCGGLSGAECGQYFLVSQFMLLFMMLPLIIPATIASYSIVGEKTTRTLEPLLATPVTDLELPGRKGTGGGHPSHPGDLGGIPGLRHRGAPAGHQPGGGGPPGRSTVAADRLPARSVTGSGGGRARPS